MAVVTFSQDVSPYMRGDVVELTSEEKKRVDELAKARGLKDVYSSKVDSKEVKTKSDK